MKLPGTTKQRKDALGKLEVSLKCDDDFRHLAKYMYKANTDEVFTVDKKNRELLYFYSKGKSNLGSDLQGGIAYLCNKYFNDFDSIDNLIRQARNRRKRSAVMGILAEINLDLDGLKRIKKSLRTSKKSIKDVINELEKQ